MISIVYALCFINIFSFMLIFSDGEDYARHFCKSVGSTYRIMVVQFTVMMVFFVMIIFSIAIYNKEIAECLLILKLILPKTAYNLLMPSIIGINILWTGHFIDLTVRGYQFNLKKKGMESSFWSVFKRLFTAKSIPFK